MALHKLAAVALALVSLAACDKEATGQVAAVVNGEEITLQEINAELASAQIPEGLDKQAVQQAALQRIIERKLLAQVASADGVDDTAEYLLRERQLREALLVQMLGQKTERAIKVPDQEAIDKYIAEHPALFANRKIYTIDRIQFAMPSDLAQLKALEDDHSLGEVADTLKRLGIDFRRDSTQFDSAQVGQQRLDKILALPDGEPFVVPENGVVTVGVITGSREAPISQAEARPLAVQAMRNEQLRDALQDRLKQARAQAEIEYQEGFAVPADDEAEAEAAPAKG